MKAKQLFLAMTLSIFMLSVSGCSTVSEEQRESMPEVSLEGTAWTLEAFIEGQTGSSLISGSEITLKFEADNVRGSAGCNDYGGAYTLERGALSIPQVDITGQLCLEPAGIMAQETRYLEILRGVTIFIWDADLLTLMTVEGVGLRFVATKTTAIISQAGPTDPLELENFLDAYFAEQMEINHIPGVVFTMVKDGEVFFSKGYGSADIETQTPFDPVQTVLTTASLAKGFTAVGVLQLYERGLIDLNEDIRPYFKNFPLATRFNEPLRFANLLTHTGGFETGMIGLAALFLVSIIISTFIVWPLGALIHKLRKKSDQNHMPRSATLAWLWAAITSGMFVLVTFWVIGVLYAINAVARYPTLCGGSAGKWSMP